MRPCLRPTPLLRASRPQRRRRRGGSSALEFALCLPVWLVVMSAIYDFSWIVLQRTTLDAALNMGCRSGAFVDPGEFDQYSDDVFAVAETATWASYESLGRGTCADCVFTATLTGSYPNRTLRCQVDRDLDPLIGLVLDDLPVSAVQVSHLEYQH